MLTRKCEKQVSKLIGKGDFNVRLTVVDKNQNQQVINTCQDYSWKEVFRDSLGGGIINDSNTTYLVSCKSEKQIPEFTITGNNVINKIWEHVYNVDVVRIDITKLPVEKNKKRSWVIARY